ncbi:rCG55794, partial [Rattus norvegicus]
MQWLRDLICTGIKSYQPAPFVALSFAYQIYHCRPAAPRHGLQTVTDPVAHWSYREHLSLCPVYSGNSQLSTKSMPCVHVEAVTWTTKLPCDFLLSPALQST